MPLPGAARGGPGGRPGGGGMPPRPSGGRPPGGRPMPGNGASAEPKYYRELTFDEGKKDYRVTKITFGFLAAMLIIAAVTIIFKLDFRILILDLIAFLFWLGYFILSIVKKDKIPTMKMSEAVTYWTYELTDEYEERNTKLAEFQREIAQSRLIDQTTKVDDVKVNLVNLNPLRFDFSIRSSNAQEKNVIREVSQWGPKFSCETGIVTKTGVLDYKVVYPIQDKWKTLAGKKISPDDAIEPRTRDVSVDWNPVGLCTTTMEEVAINNSTSHTVISGQSGYGKSNLFNMLLYNLFDTDALIIFFDAKRVEAAAIRDRCYEVFTKEQASAWVKAILEDLKARSAYQAAHGAKKFATPEAAAEDDDATPFTDEFPPVIIAVDECAQWLGSDKYGREFTDFLTKVAQVGRSCGVILVIASQQTKSGSIPSGARANIAQMIAFKTISPAEDEFAIGTVGTGEPVPSSIPDKTAGGGGGLGQCCIRSAYTDGKVLPVKAYFVKGEMMSKKAKETRTKKKMYQVVQDAQRIYEESRAKAKDGATWDNFIDTGIDG